MTVINRLSRMLCGVITKEIGPGLQQVTSKSHKLLSVMNLLSRGHPGAFYLLPEVLKATQKLEKMIDTHMAQIGCQRILIPTLSPLEMWEESGRREAMKEILFKVSDSSGRDYCLSPTCEEMVTTLVKNMPVLNTVYPLRLYQINTKFRDESNPQDGLLRCREFQMKDLYTFDISEVQAEQTYEEVVAAYESLFKMLEIPVVKVAASTGDIGGSKSHEFHILTPVGEDTVFTCDSCNYAVNLELLPGSDKETPIPCTQSLCIGTLHPARAIEVAHTFLLGDKYSKIFGAEVVTNDSKRPLVMGCYGIGVTRLVAASLESMSSAKALRWPMPLAPYRVSIISQKRGHAFEVTKDLAEQLYMKLDSLPHLCGDVLLDDRHDFSIGSRLKHATITGLPRAVVLGNKSRDDPPMAEVIDLYQKSSVLVPFSEVADHLQL